MTFVDVVYLGPHDATFDELGETLDGVAGFAGDFQRVTDLYSAVAWGLLHTDSICFVSPEATISAKLAVGAWVRAHADAGQLVLLCPPGHLPSRSALRELGAVTTVSATGLDVRTVAQILDRLEGRLPLAA